MKRNIFIISGLIVCLSIFSQGYESPTLSLDADQYKELEKHFLEKEKLKRRASDWADFKRYHDANLLVEKPVDAVFIGNSITDSWATTHPEFFIVNNFEGRGISGQTSSEMLVRFQADVIDLQPKMVVILAGCNDIAENNGYISLDHALKNIKSMCELAVYHNIKPILCSVLPAHRYKWNPSVDAITQVKAINILIKAYADENNIPYVDYYNVLVDNRGGLPLELAADGVHPNLEGYVIMEAVLQKVIQPYL